MSVTVEYNSDDSRISGMRGWRKWKAYANEKRANEATTHWRARWAGNQPASVPTCGTTPPQS